MSKMSFYQCDVCLSDKDVENIQMQMLRHFDCTDGRTFSDYLVVEKIDLCKLCHEGVIKSGRYLVDERVQGHGDIVLHEVKT